MAGETFKLNLKDFSAYVAYGGATDSYEPLKGLPDKYTEDNTLHTDIRAYKATYIRRLIPVSLEIAREILAEYMSESVWLTIYDKLTGADKTVLCCPDQAAITSLIYGDQMSELKFKEL